MHLVTKSLSRSFVHTFIHPFIHSIILSFIRSFIHSFVIRRLIRPICFPHITGLCLRELVLYGSSAAVFSIVLPWGSRGNTWYTALTNKCGRLLCCKPKMGLQGVTKERKNMLGHQNVSVCFVPWSIYKIIQNQLFFCIHIVTSWFLKMSL